MKAFALFASFAAPTLADKPDYEGMWLKFKADYNKHYDSNGNEEQKRLEVFKGNVDVIEEHNAKKLSYWLGVNEFADLTWDEFSSTHLGFAGKGVLWRQGFPRKSSSSHLGGKVSFPDNATTDADSIDWVAKGAVTPVKNQKHCGSCWAFSATGALEGAYFVASGKLVSLSEEDLVQCDHGGDHGCQGGLMDNAFKFVEKNGISLEADYPYTSGSGVTGSCKSRLEHRPAVTIKSYIDVPSRDENALKAAASKQPVAVAIEADRSAFQFYRGGILDNPGCGQQLDHGVLLVGYGTGSGKDYWKVKNSWGATWGEQGYIRMVRNKNQCGISNMASYPTGAEAAPPPVLPTPAPPMPTGCKIEGPSYTIDQSCKAAYSDLGSGKCLTKDGKDPASSYHAGLNAQACQELCDGNSKCGGFSLSSYENCLIWLDSGLVGGGDYWGGAHCYVKPPTHAPCTKYNSVKDAGACASLCKATSECTAFHYYGIGDVAYGDCYLHSAGIPTGPLHDGRDRYAGTCDSLAAVMV